MTFIYWAEKKDFLRKKNHKRVIFVFHYDTESFDKIRYEEKKERNYKLMFHGNVVVFYYLVFLFWCHQDICGTLVTDLRFYILLWKRNRIIKNFYIPIEECFFILFYGETVRLKCNQFVIYLKDFFMEINKKYSPFVSSNMKILNTRDLLQNIDEEEFILYNFLKIFRE